MVPAVGNGLVNRVDAGILEFEADILELGVRRGDAQALLLKDLLVVGDDEVVGGNRVPDLGTVDLAVEADLVERDGVVALRPLFAGQIDGVLLDVVLDLEVRLATLAAKNVGGFARVELGLEHAEVLVGRNDLVVDVDAGP